MDNQTNLTSLRTVLAVLYEDTESAKRIATDAGLDTGRITWTAHAQNNWYAVLREANKANAIAALLAVARQEYPTNQPLQEAWAAYQRSGVAPQDDGTARELTDEPAYLPEHLRSLPCPYRGLEPFEVEHAANYFGRGAMVQKLLDKLAATNFVAVVGPSGSGKSSLVRAGLLTALRAGRLPGSKGWDIILLRPGEDPLRALSQPLVERITANLTPVDRLTETRKLADRLRDRTLPLGDVLEHLREQPAPPQRLLLLIDQFEEAFTLCTDDTLRRTFLAALLTAAETPWVTVLFTVRADFFGRILEDEPFGQWVDAGLVNVLPMNEAERRAAIEQPALNAGRRFEEGLVQRILDALATAPGELPLLEFALTELWERQTPEGVLIHAEYAAIGELTGALAQRADTVLKRFTPAEQAAVRKVFTRLVRVAQPDEAAEDTKRRINLDELEAASQSLVRQLADARLLVTAYNAETGEETVEVAHEALIRNWDELKRWLNGDREFLLWRQRLRVIVANWQGSGQDAGALLRGALLTEGRSWLQTRATDLNEQEQAFIVTSQTVADQEAQEREAARQRELTLQRQRTELERKRAEEQTQAAAALRRWAQGLVLVSICAVLFALAAGYLGNLANRNAHEANTQKATAVAAQQTAEANADLANQQLARLAGVRLLQEAEKLKGEGKVTEAIAAYAQAAAVETSLKIDLVEEEKDVRRQAAVLLVHAGEQLARNGDLTGAAQKYQAALDLKPPLDSLVYVHVPAGEFMMGADPSVDKFAQSYEQPQQKVMVHEFWIQRTEVTNAQYGACVQAKACDPPTNTHSDRPQISNWPVTDVSWRQAISYTTWLGGRLPSEAEWEKACRGTDALVYPWGNSVPDVDLANFSYNESTLTNVGSYPKGQSPYGLLDMAGNVWEWTSSLHKNYPYKAAVGREDPKADGRRTMRGGSFVSDGLDVRCAARLGYDPTYRSFFVGFRVVSPGF